MSLSGSVGKVSRSPLFLNFLCNTIILCVVLFSTCTTIESRIIERTTPHNYKPITNEYFSNESPVHSPQAQEDEAKLMPDTLPPATKRNINDPEIVEATHWAIQHLRLMSDSDIFTSLRLSRILEASSAVGIFHHNIFVTVELVSPYFLDNIEASIHKIIIMTDMDDQSRSYAIDEFPVMEPSAIETFWMKKVDIHRLEREIEFLKLEYEYHQWVQKKQRLMKEGKMEAKGCTDACVERQEAINNYTWYTDREFFKVIGSSTSTIPTALSSIAIDLQNDYNTVEEYYMDKERLKNEKITVQTDGSVKYL